MGLLLDIYGPYNICFNIRDHVSQPYSTTGNINVLYILIFKLLERSLEDNVWTES